MTNLIPIATPPSAGGGGCQIHEWLHGLIEIAKVCVIFAGGYFSHWLLLRRDVAGRKKAFLGFLRQWRTEICAVSRGPTTVSVSTPTAVIAYDARVGYFLERVEIVRGDYSDAERFEALTSRLGSLKAEDWKDKTQKEVILYALDEFIKFAT